MSNDQPNLLIIHTDQLSWWALGCYGGRVVETPNIDRLAAEGARLTNFFTNSAVCTPSRGCFLTGRYPHCHGAYRNNIALNRDEITFARINDSEQRNNLYHDPGHRDVVESLTEKIIQHHVEVCSPATSWLYSCRKENS